VSTTTNCSIRRRKNQRSAIALSKDRTLGITIRIETRKCDRNTEMKSDRPNGNFKVLGIEYCELTNRFSSGKKDRFPTTATT
jgi:hypothetical protein